MSKRAIFLKSAAVTAFLGLAVWGGVELTRPPYDGTAGFAEGTASAPVRAQSIGFHIWYPALPGGRAITVGGNGVFQGTAAGRGAPHRHGRFPVIVMSHGAGGNAGQFGWIASRLAEAGFVVLLPNHPGTTSGNASAEAAARVWERPADVTAVIDEITAHPDRYPHIDTTRIGMLGFSAGGYTTMAIAGARVDPDRLQRFCDDTDHGMSDCGFFARFGVDLHAMDLNPAARDLRDPRVSAAVVVDPGIIETVTADSLAAISIPLLILNLGDAGTIPAGVDAAAAAAIIPGATYRSVPDAIHFSFLAECKPRGAAILADEGEADPLCDDAGGRSRAAIHDALIQAIVPFFQGQW